MKNEGRKWLLIGAKLAILAILVWFVRSTIVAGLAELEDYSWQINPAWLIAAAAVYIVGFAPAGLFWRRVLIALGQQPKLAETLRAYYIGHLGKYVPGKALVVILRAGLIRSQRVDGAIAAVSVFVETLTQMAVGAMIAAAILATMMRDKWLPVVAALGLMVAAGVPTLPPVFQRLVRWLGVVRLRPDVGERLAGLTWRLMVGGWFANVVVWLLMGLSLWMTLRAIGLPKGPFGQELPLCVAAVALAVVAGFLSLIPGGAGVREFFLLEVMASYFAGANIDKPNAVALGSVLLLRLVWLAAELAVAGALYVAFRGGR